MPSPPHTRHTTVPPAAATRHHSGDTTPPPLPPSPPPPLPPRPQRPPPRPSPLQLPSFKVVLLNGHSCGKTSLVQQFTKRTFSRYQEATLGAAFSVTRIHVAGTAAKLEIWDTAGQDQWEELFLFLFF
eukprot:TRINITY_DN3755_c0_g1_i2.p1 TRINITY_DN3755_c0_g1~~TRINITY_DN3755_c0_g1_i2.p1  ORF type:complete len:128 (+),score=35.37 TRINITY_DN3755_c0_g1_i2:59-442(+)